MPLKKTPLLIYDVFTLPSKTQITITILALKVFKLMFILQIKKIIVTSLLTHLEPSHCAKGNYEFSTAPQIVNSRFHSVLFRAYLATSLWVRSPQLQGAHEQK